MGWSAKPRDLMARWVAKIRTTMGGSIGWWVSRLKWEWWWVGQSSVHGRWTSIGCQPEESPFGRSSSYFLRPLFPSSLHRWLTHPLSLLPWPIDLSNHYVSWLDWSTYQLLASLIDNPSPTSFVDNPQTKHVYLTHTHLRDEMCDCSKIKNSKI